MSTEFPHQPDEPVNPPLAQAFPPPGADRAAGGGGGLGATPMAAGADRADPVLRRGPAGVLLLGLAVVPRNLVRDLAENNGTAAQLAEKYGKAEITIKKFLQRNRAETCLRKAKNSWCRCRFLHKPVTFPVAMSKAANNVVVPCRT